MKILLTAVAIVVIFIRQETSGQSCVAAGYSSCCTSGCSTAGGCYCDRACYSASDCCADINETCPQTTTVGSTTQSVTDLYHPTPSTKTTLQELYPTTNPDTETDPGATVERKLAVQTREAIAWALLFLVALLFSGLLFINVILFLKYKHEQRRNSTAQAPAYDLADNPCYESSKISNTLETNIYEQVETCENA